MPQYLTDGYHLYSVEGVIRNYGLAGGHFLTVRNCSNDLVRQIGPLEAALCTPVR